MHAPDGLGMIGRIQSHQPDLQEHLKLQPGNAYYNRQDPMIKPDSIQNNPMSEKLRQLQLEQKRYRAGMESHNI